MSTVLILGASGYLGLPLAKSRLRSGNYIVYGLARTPAKAKTLAQNEIVPVIGDVTDPNSFNRLISSVPIDVVIDATSAYEAAGILLSIVTAASKSRISTLAKESSAGPNLGFVYISGSSVHGNQNTPVSDTVPPGTTLANGKPATAVGWRPAHEQCILAARDVPDVAIVHLGLEHLFWPLARGRQERQHRDNPGPCGARPSIVHLDDAVSGVRRSMACWAIGRSLISWEKPCF